MKWVCRFIFPVLLLLSVEVKSQAYTYHPFPDSNTTWRGIGQQCAMGNCWPSGYIFSITGDTVINSLTYHKIPGAYYFREDSNKRVYYIGWYNLQYDPERLLYDFSLSAGDTMYTNLSYYYVVRSIDTILYNGLLRRTLHVSEKLNAAVTDHWIEGIGSNEVPFHWSLANPVLCDVTQDSVLIYGPVCSLYNDLQALNTNKTVVLYPNPSTTSFTLQLSTPPTTQTYFQLYDALGRQVKREEINSSSTTINRNNLPGGIYFWQLLSENKILDRGKLVIE